MVPSGNPSWLLLVLRDAIGHRCLREGKAGEETKTSSQGTGSVPSEPGVIPTDRALS